SRRSPGPDNGGADRGTARSGDRGGRHDRPPGQPRRREAAALRRRGPRRPGGRRTGAAAGMTPAVHQLASTLRLQLRNRMGMIYGYVFPTIFLVSFGVLYRYEPVPIIRHLRELLTVTALGGACFGLPTTMVSERERGVWRRYRLAPV